MMLEIMVEADEEWDSSKELLSLVRSAAEAAVAESAFPELAASPRDVELSIRLAGDTDVRALNAEWRGKDKATNVLSFPLATPSELALAKFAGPQILLGDIILARGVCAAEAAEKAIPLEHHAAHLAAHGTLHLLGHDHQDEAGADDMERREIRALARLGIADPYGNAG
ncbi:MAG TPA: rRNA maturation RNase YbeY [Sphingomicrobium sp.]|nr:rRNA maturation RNase YbeY [Sphingomicrobium sp.]